MSRLSGFVSVVFASLVLTAAVGCSSTVDEPQDVAAPNTLEVAPQAITAGTTDGTGTTTGTTSGTIVERPKCDQACVYSGCMSSCSKDHANRTWCDAYCFCRAVARGGTIECSNLASESFIDL